MPNLFGIDIAAEINKGFSQAGGLVSGTLTSRTPGTRTPGNLTAGTNPSTNTHTFQGFLEKGERRIPGTRSVQQGDFVTILGASITPAIEPSPGFKITIEGGTFDIVEIVERDPAAATYVCRVQR